MRHYSNEELESLGRALGEIVEQGDIGAARTVVWIAYEVSRLRDGLDFSQRLTFAELAGRAARRSGTASLSALAVRLLDPVLWSVGRGEESLEPEHTEHLNDIRLSLTRDTARNGLL